MPTPRHPVMQQFLEECATYNLTGKEAYEVYKKEGIPKKIGAKVVGIGRFMNMYYPVRSKLLNTQTLTSDTNAPIQTTSFKLFGIPIFSKTTRRWS